MARDFNGATDTAVVASSPLTAVPITLACWFNNDTLSGNDAYVELDDNSTNNVFLLYTAGSTLNAFVSSPGTNQASATGVVSASTWTHGCAVFSANNARACYRDGANKGTDANANTPTGISRVRIGSQPAANFADARIAEVGIWSAALDDSEVAALAKGISPLLIRPTSLVAYFPLLGNDSPEIDKWRNSLSLSLTGTTKADHPRVYMPASSV